MRYDDARQPLSVPDAAVPGKPLYPIPYSFYHSGNPPTRGIHSSQEIFVDMVNKTSVPPWLLFFLSESGNSRWIPARYPCLFDNSPIFT